MKKLLGQLQSPLNEHGTNVADNLIQLIHDITVDGDGKDPESLVFEINDMTTFYLKKKAAEPTHALDVAVCPDCGGSLNKCSACGVVVSNNPPRK